MNCNKNCKCCNNRLISTSVAITGAEPNQVLTITVPNQTFENLERKCLIIAQAIPTGANNIPVQIQSGDVVIPVMVKTGNFLRADQIRCRRRYSIIYGNDPLHFSLENCVRRTCYEVIPAEVKVE